MPTIEGRLIKHAEEHMVRRVRPKPFYSFTVADTVEEGPFSGTTFISVIAFITPLLSLKLMKGCKVRISGKLETSTYTRDDGTVVPQLKMLVDDDTLEILEEGTEEPAPPMTLAAFYRELECHDWYNAFSDDSLAYVNGERHYKKLASVATQSSAHKALFDGFRAHHFSGEPWNTPKAPKPMLQELAMS